MTRIDCFWLGFLTHFLLVVAIMSITACTTAPLPEPHGPVYLTNPSAIRSLRGLKWICR
jgi:hypothetical protein